MRVVLDTAYCILCNASTRVDYHVCVEGYTIRADRVELDLERRGAVDTNHRGLVFHRMAHGCTRST